MHPANSRDTAAPVLRVRWVLFAFIFAASFVAYLQRSSLSVVAAGMMPALGITQVQMAWLFTAFLAAYTLLQFPGGLIGQHIGPRRTVLATLLLSTAGTAATAFAPVLATGLMLVAVLAGVRGLVGAAQGPLFPSTSGLMEAWFPPRRWALVLGLEVTGLSLGAAATPPLLATVMQSFGWQAALYVTCLPGLVLAAFWWHAVRDTPREHRAMTAAELAEIEPAPRAAVARRLTWHEILALLADRNVLLLTLSYLLMNYVYYFFINWSFLYLVQERQLTLLQGGWLASLPLLAGSLGGAFGGQACDLLCHRLGARRGVRVLPLLALPLASVLLLVAVNADSAWAAVAALAGCFGFVQTTEAPYWAGTFWVARERSAAATGLLNTGGNVGGVIGTPIVGYLTAGQHWTAAFAVGVGCALASAALWLLIDVDQRPSWRAQG